VWAGSPLQGGVDDERPVNPKGLAPSEASGLDRPGASTHPPHPPRKGRQRPRNSPAGIRLSQTTHPSAHRTAHRGAQVQLNWGQVALMGDGSIEQFRQPGRRDPGTTHHTSDHSPPGPSGQAKGRSPPPDAPIASRAGRYATDAEEAIRPLHTSWPASRAVCASRPRLLVAY
jgi:hypothetical protein